MIKPLAASISVAFLLIVSLLASSAFAVPLSRTLKYVDSPRIVPDCSAQAGLHDLRRYEEERRGRKLLEIHTDDYGGTGANGKHDPSTGSR